MAEKGREPFTTTDVTRKTLDSFQSDLDKQSLCRQTLNSIARWEAV